PGGPADKAGVQAGDVVLKFNGTDVQRVSDLPRMVGGTAPDTKATLQVWRRGKTLELPVVVDTLDSEEDSKPTAGSREKESTAKTNALGLAVTDLTEEERRELRVRGGVRVERAEGAAVEVGIAQGDILLALNNNDITSATQFAEMVDKLDKSRTHVLLVRRGNITQWVPLQLAR
nr:PDZ domain-containing protein [Pseudomonas sp.]